MKKLFTLKSGLFSLIISGSNLIFAQTTVVGGLKNRLGNITSTKATTDSAMGIGTSSPDGKMEVLYCPLFGQDHNGLVITKKDCHVGQVYGGYDGHFNDVIAFGSTTTEPSYYPSPVSPAHLYTSNTPLGFPLSSINNNLNPIFWARVQTPVNGITTSGDDSRFIVFPDGRTGINIANPRCALDVRSFGVNKPAAIFGVNAQRGPITTTIPNQRYTKHVEIVPHLSQFGYNRISQTKDLGIFFTDGLGNMGTNTDGALVIAPWSDTNITGRSVGGLRMDKYGNIELRGNLRCLKVNTSAKWWPDFVFSPEYKLLSLDSVSVFVNKYKHLPGFPSQDTILSEGQDLGELQQLQQKQIEELVLYTISQEKKIKSQEEIILSQEKRLKEIELKLHALLNK
ncbi:MAG: hypothetical protein NBV77_04660 [Bacteroidia bacterium]|nr:hypothetical protein [Bacteroidia bacterium]